MKNKHVKQMISDIVLQGRKAVWYGEESEIFAAKNEQHCEDEFHEGYIYSECGIISSSYKFWWKPFLFEMGDDEPLKGKLVDVYYQELPLICGVYGGGSLAYLKWATMNP